MQNGVGFLIRVQQQRPSAFAPARYSGACFHLLSVASSFGNGGAYGFDLRFSGAKNRNGDRMDAGAAAPASIQVY
jgi:hypothetical protein